MRSKSHSVIASWIIICASVLTFTMIPSQNAVAQGDAANMGDIVVTAVPDSQGAGGSITIIAEIAFYGGCCYPLWANDVQASLNMPEGVNIVDGPTPSNYDVIEAKAGGEADYYYFQWNIKSMIPGNYNVSVIVTSENCGTGEGRVGFTVSEGCIMSIPEIYPELAPTNREINLNVDASSPIEGITIDDVVLFYMISDKELNIAKAKNDLLYYKDGSSESGTHLQLERDETTEHGWKGTIPSQSTTTYLYYWIMATDSDGNTTTSPAYTLKIEDLQEANLLINLAFWMSILLTITGMELVAVFIRFSKRRAIRKSTDKLQVIGSEEISRYGSDLDKQDLMQKRIKRFRTMTFILLIILTVVFVVWALISNMYDEVLYVVEGGL